MFRWCINILRNHIHRRRLDFCPACRLCAQECECRLCSFLCCCKACGQVARPDSVKIASPEIFTYRASRSSASHRKSLWTFVWFVCRSERCESLLCPRFHNYNLHLLPYDSWQQTLNIALYCHLCEFPRHRIVMDLANQENSRRANRCKLSSRQVRLYTI